MFVFLGRNLAVLYVPINLTISITFIPVIILLEIYYKEIIVDAEIEFCLLNHGEQKNGCNISFHQ